MAVTKISNSGIKTGVLKYDSMLAGNAAYDPYSYHSIASATGTGSSGTITFSNIPSTYESLQIHCLMREAGTGGTTGASNLSIQLNSDTASNYPYHQLLGNGTTVSATGSAATTSILFLQNIPNSGNTANVMGVTIIDIHDYASTTRNKTVRGFFGNERNGAGRAVIGSGLWMQTSAVTSITLTAVGINFSTSSQFALYGIKGS